MVITKNKVLIIQPIHEKALALLDARDDVSYEVLTDFSEETLLKHVGSADAITVRDAPISRKVIEQAISARIVSRHGVGFDNVPVDLCTEMNIPVTIVGPVNAVSVSEHTMFLLLAAARVGIELDSAVREGRFAARANTLSVELNGKTLLLIGCGRIGTKVAHRATALGMRVLVFDPYLSDSTDMPITLIGSLGEALKQADAVSLHVPLTDETQGILGERELALLPQGAIVVNASRGGLIDENALIHAMRSGKLHGAGLDTFEMEPLPPESPLAAEKRIVLSPHSAALTEDALIGMGMKTVENVLAAFDGMLDPELVVNKEVLEEER